MVAGSGPGVVVGPARQASIGPVTPSLAQSTLISPHCVRSAGGDTSGSRAHTWGSLSDGHGVVNGDRGHAPASTDVSEPPPHAASGRARIRRRSEVRIAAEHTRGARGRE